MTTIVYLNILYIKHSNKFISLPAEEILYKYSRAGLGLNPIDPMRPDGIFGDLDPMKAQSNFKESETQPIHHRK